jgi:phosphatidylglycerol:prolipoprotein diacylglycerol transferase
MHPIFLRIPFVHLTIWSFGAMTVVGFVMGMLLTRRMARRSGLDPEVISDVALYCLIVGLAGARAFYVIHHLDQFHGGFLDMIAVWRGGLEFVGGAIPAIIVLLLYLHHRNLPVRRYFDILAVGLMFGLAFGRIGCFLNGCCFGKPADLPWAVRFPYRSYAYISQINPDLARDRAEPRLPLPQAEYFDFYAEDGTWYPKPLAELTRRQRREVTEGKYRCLPIHPTQLYAFANALLLCAILYASWRKSLPSLPRDKAPGWPWRPGLTVALAFLLYGVARFILESLRDDNPFEFASLTISQLVGIAVFIVGIFLLAAVVTAKPDEPGPQRYTIPRLREP